MGSRLAWSLYVMAGASALWMVGLAAVWLKYRSVRGRRAIAERLADRLNLALPPEAADRLGRRLYRRTVFMVLVGGIGISAWMAWYSYYTILIPESRFKPGTVSPQLYAIPAWAFGGVVYALGHVYDLMRSSRETGSRVARIVEPPVSDAVPPVLTWLLRVSGLFPAAAACVWLFAPVSVQHGPQAVHPHPVLYIGAAVLGPLAVVATEAAQRRILSGRQHAATVGELAFDDGLRVQTMLSVMMVPWAACGSLAAVVIVPLSRNHDWSGALVVTVMMGLGIMALAGAPIALQSKWAGRYYLKRFAAYSDYSVSTPQPAPARTPPPPPPPPPPVVPGAAAC